MKHARHMHQLGSDDIGALMEGCTAFSGRWPERPTLYAPHLRSRLRSGRGVGDPPSSWLRVRDVPSRGTSHKITQIRLRRLHHVLSDYEEVYFYLVERRRLTAWICTGWPILDIAETLRLCAKFGVSHPYRNGYPEPITLDFLVAEKVEGGSERVRATAIKSPEDAEDPAVLRTLAVPQAWCDEHGLPCALADFAGIQDLKTIRGSLLFLRWWFRTGALAPTPSEGARFASAFMDSYQRNVALEELIARTARALQIQQDWATQMFRYAGWWGDIPVDVQRQIELLYPLILQHPCAGK